MATRGRRKTYGQSAPQMARTVPADHEWKTLPRRNDGKSVFEDRMFVIQAYYPSERWINLEQYKDKHIALGRAMRLRCEYPLPIRIYTFYGEQKIHAWRTGNTWTITSWLMPLLEYGSMPSP